MYGCEGKYVYKVNNVNNKNMIFVSLLHHINSYIRINTIIAILFVLHSKQSFGVKDIGHNFEIHKEIVWKFFKFQNEYAIRRKIGKNSFLLEDLYLFEENDL